MLDIVERLWSGQAASPSARRCEQCGGPARDEAGGGGGPFCTECRRARQRLGGDPVAAAWHIDEDTVTVRRVWPVTVNLHRFHLASVLEGPHEVPERIRRRASDEA